MKNLGNSSDTALELTLPGLTPTRVYTDRGTCEVKAPKILCQVAFITRDTSTHVTVWTTVAQAATSS